MELHPGQKKVLNDPSSKKLVIVGARWGKTTLAVEMALQRCLEKKRKIHLYGHDMRMMQVYKTCIYERMEELGLKFEKEHNGVYFFLNGSQLITDVFPYFDEIIFDDALDHIGNLTIMLTPLGWKMHNGPTMQNPAALATEDSRGMHSKEFARAMFDGDLEDEYNRFKMWYTLEYKREPDITRTMFNRICSDPIDDKKIK